MANGIAQTADGRTEVALITGASSGIGEALAECFANAGFELVLVARNVEKLKSLSKELSRQHGVKCQVASSDLSQPGAAQKLAASMKRAKRPIDVLVNCAGLLHFGSFVQMPVQYHQSMIDLNITGLTTMIAHFSPAMVERGYGRVLNVASIAAFQPIPSLATYAATKAYVLSLPESLSEEFKGTGVSMTALCPGITATNMLASAKAERNQLSKLPGFLIGDARTVAREGFDACMRADVIKVPGVINQATILAGRATPKWLLRRFSGAMSRTVKS